MAGDPVRVTPQRIQMTRRPGGWRAQHPDAVIVDRSTRWGNPCHWEARPTVDAATGERTPANPAEARRISVEAFRRQLADPAARAFNRYPSIAEIRAELAGRSLACWCPLPAPGEPDVCHGAVLLRVAAGGEP